MRPFQVGVFSNSLHPASPEELFERLAKLKLRVIQLGLIDYAWHKPSVVASLERHLKRSGIAVAASFFGFPDEDYSSIPRIRETGGLAYDFEARLKVIRKVIKISAQLGIPAVGAHAGFVPEDPRDPQYGVMIQRIGRVADEMKKAGLRMLLETGQETPDGLLQVLKDLGRDNVGINFDPANLLLYGVGEPVTAVKKLGPYIASIHAKDAVPSGRKDEWGTERLLGEGAVNYPKFLRALRDAGFRGPLIIECEIPGTDPMHNVTHARDFLRRCLREMKSA
ncbi:MAG: sugar phosphate isomerase/epimerase [Candidatus Sumerlaeia bacterium]|nr:sugar phosphate isomerase/epimerase [Candidatus Sumerlaeia bacterium]